MLGDIRTCVPLLWSGEGALNSFVPQPASPVL
jgi:hypothetical protein